MPAGVIRALVPTAIAAVLLSQEFPLANLDTDGTLFTVVIYGVSYSDAIARISGWMSRSHIGPVLVDRRRDLRAAPVRSCRPQATDLSPPVSTLACLMRVPGSRRPRHTRLQVRSAHGVTVNTALMPRSTVEGRPETLTSCPSLLDASGHGVLA